MEQAKVTDNAEGDELSRLRERVAQLEQELGEARKKAVFLDYIGLERCSEIDRAAAGLRSRSVQPVRRCLAAMAWAGRGHGGSGR